MMVSDVSTDQEVTTPAENANGDETTDQAVESTSDDESQAEETEASDADESDGKTEPEVKEPPKKKSGIQRLKERHARELNEIRREIETLKSPESRSQRPQEPEVSKPSDKPRADTWEGTHEEYLEALTDWKLEQREKANAEKSREAQAKEAYKSQTDKYNERLEKFKAQTPEFDQALEEFLDERGDAKLSMGLHQAILESEDGPALMLELFKKPEEFDRINALSPFAVAKEIGRMEARLAKAQEEKPAVQKSNTPKPPTPIGGKSASAVKKSIFDKDLSFEDFERLRKEQLKAKG